MSTAIRASAAMALTEVPPLTVPTVKVVLGSDGGLQLGDFRDRPAHGVDGARQAELLEGMPAGTLEDHLIAWLPVAWLTTRVMPSPSIEMKPSMSV